MLMCSGEIFIIFVLLVNQFDCSLSEWESKQLQSMDLDSIEFFSNIMLSKEQAIEHSQELIKKWMSDQNIPGVVFGISTNGTTLWTEGFGEMDVENSVKTDKKAIWRLASLSKPLTAALIAQLADSKQLDLDDQINNYLPNDSLPVNGFKGKGFKIAIRHVLTHTAGLYLTKIPEDFENIYKAHNVTQTIEQFSEEKLVSVPGEKYTYSNYGYQLLGAVIETVLNDTFQNQIKKMCASLGMKSTFAETPKNINEHRARYYMPSPVSHDQLDRADLIDDLFSYEGWWPSVAMVSTVDDMLRFGNAMLDSYNGKREGFLSQKIVKYLWTPEKIGDRILKNGNGYGKGWFFKQIENTFDYPYKTLIWHSGGLLGTSTLLFIFPEANLVAVGLSNKGSVIGLDRTLLLVAKSFNNV